MKKTYQRRTLIKASAGAAIITPAVLAASTVEAIPEPEPEPKGGDLVARSLPTRVYDSREPGSVGGGARLQSGSSIAVPVSGAFEDGVNFARSVFVNCTVTGTQGFGWLTIVGLDTNTGTPDTGTSNVNWSMDGQTLANLALTPVGSENSIEVICGGNGATHFIIDVQGYVPFP